MEELRSRQEAERKYQEVSHSQKMEALIQQYEVSIQGVSNTTVLYTFFVKILFFSYLKAVLIDIQLDVFSSELKSFQQTELENLEKTLKDTESSLSVRC